jgi:hypothetical protein
MTVTGARTALGCRTLRVGAVGLALGLVGSAVYAGVALGADPPQSQSVIVVHNTTITATGSAGGASSSSAASAASAAAAAAAGAGAGAWSTDISNIVASALSSTGALPSSVTKGASGSSDVVVCESNGGVTVVAPVNGKEVCYTNGNVPPSLLPKPTTTTTTHHPIVRHRRARRVQRRTTR